MNRKIILPITFLLLTQIIFQINSGNCFSENTNLNYYKQTSLFFLDTNQNNSLTISDAVNFVKEISGGEVISAERRFKKSDPVWEIILISEEGSFVKMEISFYERTVYMMNSDEGPFTYDIKPATDLISLSEAIKIADSRSSQKVLKWKFLKVKDKWEYNFWLFTKSGKAQLRLDAETGETITGKKTKKNK